MVNLLIFLNMKLFSKKSQWQNNLNWGNAAGGDDSSSPNRFNVVHLSEKQNVHVSAIILIFQKYQSNTY